MSSKTTPIAISAKGLSKSYVLGEQRGLGNSRGKGERSILWALDDISFDLHHGEAVGIIGHNGSGKSTLLKLLSRITEPTRGMATIHGRVASLLEVGTGFHPELTGRENIFMNGSILGMRKIEIARHFDEIVDFAGLDRFIDTPVKRYSSGMQVRLAFSVAAHLQPEILIIDEVLAVGDMQFQKKCLGKMGDASRSGRTVLFVSHNMAAVRQLTSRCIVLSAGKKLFDGAPEQGIDAYSNAMAVAFGSGTDLAKWPRLIKRVDLTAEFQSLEFDRSPKVFDPDESINFKVRIRALEKTSGLRLTGSIMHVDGYPIGTFWTRFPNELEAGSITSFDVNIGRIGLAPGSFSFKLGLATGGDEQGFREVDVIGEVLPFEVSAINNGDGVMGSWHPTWGSIRFPEALVVMDESLNSLRRNAPFEVMAK